MCVDEAVGYGLLYHELVNVVFTIRTHHDNELTFPRQCYFGWNSLRLQYLHRAHQYGLEWIECAYLMIEESRTLFQQTGRYLRYHHLREPPYYWLLCRTREDPYGKLYD